MKAIIKKMKSQKGFSLVEMLVATLILGLSTSALVAGVTASIRVYHASVTYSEERMLLSTLSEALTNELRNAKEAKLVKNNGKYILDTYTSSTYGFNAKVEVEINKEQSADTNPETDARPGGVIKVSGHDLVGSGVYINNQLSAQLGEISYENNCYTFTISVYSGSNKEPETREIWVTPLETPEIPDEAE